MGATQSKSPSEPVIFYNQNVPLQFSQGFADSLEARKPSVSETNNARSEDVEETVRKRVAEELKKTQKQEDITQQAYSELAKKNIDNDQNSIALGADIDNMIQRIKRSSPKEIPADIAESQEALVVCYRNNESRPLDCWEEVEKFKASVAKAQKRFVAAHQ